MAASLCGLLISCGGGGSATEPVAAIPPSATPPTSPAPVAPALPDPIPVPPPVGPPVITAQPASQTVVEDAPVIWSVQLQDAGGVGYQWLRNGLPVAGAQQASYTLPAAGWDDDASAWSVRVSNAGGSVVSSAARLTITERAVQTPLGLSDFKLDAAGEMPLAVDSRGNVITVSADLRNPVLRKYSPSGHARALGPNPGGMVLAPLTFHQSISFALDSFDNLYVAYTGYREVGVLGAVLYQPIAGEMYVISPTGNTRLLWVQHEGDPGFAAPVALSADRAGAIYLADVASHSVLRLAPDGSLAPVTLAGTVGYPINSFTDVQLAVGGPDLVYQVDGLDQIVYRNNLDGKMAALAGQTGVRSVVDGRGYLARFGWPRSPVTDAAGNLYVLDRSDAGSFIRQVTRSGLVTTLVAGAGGSGAFNFYPVASSFPDALNVGPLALQSEQSLAIGPDDVLYFKAGNRIMKARLR